MTSSFDPYYKWLGIPPEDQPPHHYRLLGVEPFESDPDVIVIAADGRMAQLKHFQTGKYSKLSQKLLNEIATAKVCLLNPEKREQYDDGLRQRLEEAKKPAVKAAPPGRKPGTGEKTPPGVAAPQINPADVSSYLSRHGQKRRNRWLLPAVGGLLSVVLVVVLVVAFGDDDNNGTAGNGDPPNGQAGNGLSNRLPGVKHPKPPNDYPPDQIPNPPPDDASPEDPGNGEPIDPDTVASAAHPGRSLAELIDPMEPGELLPPGAEHPEVPEEGDPDDPPTARRLPVPDAAAKKEAEGEIRAAFKSELAAAKTPKLKLELAESLLAESREPGNEPAVRFMLIQMACQTAAEAGGLAESLAAAAELKKQYDVDGKQIRSYVFKTVGELLGTVVSDFGGLLSIVDVATQQAGAALAGDDLATAVSAMRLADAAAKVTKDNYIRAQVIARTKEIDTLRRVFDGIVKKALETLAERPDDPAPNWEVGRWRCFCTGAWQAGLPMLAKGSDDKTAELARLDVAQPKGVRDQVRLGDGWFAVADKEAKYAKVHVYLRAKHWYELALPSSAGIEKKHIESRLKEIAKVLQDAGPQLPESVQPGNLALAANGATVAGIKMNPNNLLDGKTAVLPGGAGTAVATTKQPFMVTLQKVYKLKEISLLLWDQLPRSYNYAVWTSINGKEFTPLVDRSQGQWTGRQRIPVEPPRLVKFIKVLPIKKLYVDKGTTGSDFTIVELEAYAIPPRR